MNYFRRDLLSQELVKLTEQEFIQEARVHEVGYNTNKLYRVDYYETHEGMDHFLLLELA